MDDPERPVANSRSKIVRENRFVGTQQRNYKSEEQCRVHSEDRGGQKHLALLLAQAEGWQPDQEGTQVHFL